MILVEMLDRKFSNVSQDQFTLSRKIESKDIDHCILHHFASLAAGVIQNARLFTSYDTVF